jgi:hypothetical protein
MMLGSAGELYNPTSGKCLDDPGSSTTNGKQLDVAPCTGAPNQAWLNTAGELWELTAYGSIENAYSQKCLADPTNSATNGRQLEIEDCYGLPGEVWAVS